MASALVFLVDWLRLVRDSLAKKAIYRQSTLRAARQHVLSDSVLNVNCTSSSDYRARMNWMPPRAFSRLSAANLLLDPEEALSIRFAIRRLLM